MVRMTPVGSGSRQWNYGRLPKEEKMKRIQAQKDARSIRPITKAISKDKP